MPHINRIRLVNVAFNDAKSLYDDLLLEFYGKSGTIDLVNGGGKTVLLMMALQVIFPNSSLRGDKPFKNIFQGGNDRTSHVLVEWILDRGSSYKYLLTGFCARKKRSSKEESNNLPVPEVSGSIYSHGDIDYFTYFHLYDSSNQYDIKRLNLSFLSGKREVMSFDKLKSLIKDLRNKNYNTGYFTKNYEYTGFLRQHNLLDREWKIIKDINSGENSIEKYFRENKTSRKMIENMLLKIIGDVESGRERSDPENAVNEEVLADTLIELRHNLEESLKKKEHLDEYNEILKFYGNLKKSNENLTADFRDLEELKGKTLLFHSKLREILQALEKEKEAIINNIREAESNIETLEFQKDCLNIQKLELEKHRISGELKEKKEKLAETKEKIDNGEKTIALLEGQNLYILYKELEYKLEKFKVQKESIYKDNYEVEKEFKILAYNYKMQLNRLMEDYKNKISAKKEEEKEEEKKKAESLNFITELASRRGELKNKLEQLEEERKKYREKLNGCRTFLANSGSSDYVLLPDRGLEETEKEEKELSFSIDETRKNIIDLEDKVIEYGNEIHKRDGHIGITEEKLKSPVSFIEKYDCEKAGIKKLAEIYECLEEDLEFKISEKIRSLRNREVVLNIEKSLADNKLEFLEQNDFYIPHEKIVSFFEKIEKKFPNILKGIDYLESQSEEEKKILLAHYPLLPYSLVLLEDDFNRLKEIKNLFEEDFCDHPFPLINLDTVRKGEKLLSESIVFLCGNDEIFIDKNRVIDYKACLQEKIESIKKQILCLRENMGEVENNRDTLRSFQKNFGRQALDKAKEEIEQFNNKLYTLKREKLEFEISIGEIKEKLPGIKMKKDELENSLSEVRELREVLKDFISFQEIERNTEKETNKIKGDLKQIIAEFERKTTVLAVIESNLKLIRENLGNLIYELENLNNEISTVIVSSEGSPINLSFEETRNKYKALNDMLGKKGLEVKSIDDGITSYKGVMENYEKQLNGHNLTLHYFREKEKAGEILLQTGDENIDRVKSFLEEEKRKKTELDEIIIVMEAEFNRVDGKIDNSKENILEKFQKEYIPVEKIETIEDISNEIKKNNALIKNYRKEKENLETGLVETEKRIDNFIREEGKYREFINEYNITGTGEDRDEELIIYDKFKGIFNKINYNIKNNGDKLNRLIEEILSRDMKFHYITGYITELRKMKVSKSLIEAEHCNRQLDKCLEIINEDIEKTKADIENLEKIQENFISKCLSRAEWILEKLKFLPGLSRIEVNGIKRNMIKMNFIDFSEEDRKERMKNHINCIVKEIGRDKKTDREKIMKRLTSRELLSQITSMDRASVKLYKVENRPEHSTYKRWEDAVGSEGQSNALYFIFAVCLISYVRRIAVENKNIHSGGIIIADNPFGTTSAIYLWEPMFNILRENDVQLIATGHNISKELISKFEINHLLKQQLMSDNSIRVYRDYRTEDELDKLEFAELEGEQMNFFGDN